MIKQKLLAVFFTGFLALLGSPSYANIDSIPSDEKILSFNSDIYVHSSSEILVEETIRVVAHGKTIKRGLIRWLPTRYRDKRGAAHRVDYEVRSVELDGVPSAYHEKYESDAKVIYVGDKRVFLKPGVYEYKITYATRNQIRYFNDFDELYWNVTGNAWPYVIEHASSTVYLPENASIISSQGYTGRSGAKGSDYVEEKINSSTIHFETTSVLPKQMGLTVAMSWPKGIVHQPTQTEETLFFLKSNPGLLWGAILLAILIAYYLFVFSKVGRDPKRGVIVPLFEPPNKLSPGAMRFIHLMGFDGKVTMVALISLATKGAITISEDSSKQYTLHQNEAFTDITKLSLGERVLFSKLFKLTKQVLLDPVSAQVISEAFEAFKVKLDKEYMDAHFRRNHLFMIPAGILTVLLCLVQAQDSVELMPAIFMLVWLCIWTVGSIGLVTSVWTLLVTLIKNSSYSNGWHFIKSAALAVPFLIGECVGFGILLSMFNELNALLLVIAFVVNGLFFYLLRRPTEEGRVVMDKIEGFKLFLEKTEKYALDKKAPKVTSEIFERFLPYALALGVETSWSNHFNHILSLSNQIDRDTIGYRPNWYDGSSWDSGNIRGFSASLATGISSSAMASTVTSSGSTGGGFSGGGGGGGGGGGW